MKKAFLCVALAVIVCTACGTTKERRKKVKDAEYKIVAKEDIPQELSGILEERKQKNFKLTYEDGEQLYIAVGYGEQKTGGYSIQIKQCYFSENALFFDTELIGPKKEEADKKAVSYPYIVIQMKKTDKNVVFQ